MEYIIAFSEPASEFARRSDAAAAPAYWGAWMAYIGAMEQAGIVVHGRGLQPPETGTVIRLRDGMRHVQDGPHPDSKEQLGGFLIVSVPDLDTALEWAGRSPAAAVGSVEVRPVLPPPAR